MQPLKKKVGEIVRTSALETKIYPGHEKRGVNDLKSPRYFATLKLYHKYVQTALSLKSQFFLERIQEFQNEEQDLPWWRNQMILLNRKVSFHSPKTRFALLNYLS